MEFSISNTPKPSWIKFLFFFIIFIITFPAFDPSYQPGLDGSYMWLFNFLFENDYEKLLDFRYPLGPLGFIKYPANIGNNFPISLLLYSVLKIAFCYLLYSFCKKQSWKLIAIAVTIVAAVYVTYDYLFVFTTFLLCEWFYSKKKILPLIFASITASVALFVKSSIGISSLSIVAITLAVSLFSKDKWPTKINSILAALLSFFLVGLLVYRSFDFLHYTYYQVFLSTGFSSAMGLYPENNWWLLFGCLVLVLFGFLMHTKKIIPLMLSFALFAAWKHGMVREGSGHVKHFLLFLILYWIVIWVSNEKKLPFLIFGILSISSFYLNIESIQGFKMKPFNLNGYQNFKTILFDYDAFVAKMDHQTKDNLYPKTLNDTELGKMNRVQLQFLDSNVRYNQQKLLDIIDTNTIDFYPFENSYAATNSLKWKGRPTVEIGGSTSLKSNLLSSKFYESNQAPRYILFHYGEDANNLRLSSIDNRLIYNDEPDVIESLFKHYSAVYKNNEFVVMQQLKDERSIKKTNKDSLNANWGDWITIPSSNYPMKAKVYHDNTLIGKLKNFLYKDNEYQIHYKLDNDSILTYRINPLTMQRGLWLDPFYGQENKSMVKSIRLICLGNRSVNSTIQVQFEELIVSDTKHLGPFGKQLR